MKTIAEAKPFKTKKSTVRVVEDNGVYYVLGRDVFGTRINEIFTSYDRAMRQFYFELCWMLNDKIMSKNVSYHE